MDVKTWTSERDIEARLDELVDHLEVVISNYLRGQFETIDQYNLHAGEVSEAYRVLVVYDYPAGFTDHAAHQLLSLVENGPRCGVHTVLLCDPKVERQGSTPLARLTHTMQRISWSSGGTALSLADPVGLIRWTLRTDPEPPITFDEDGLPTTPCARLLLDIGNAAREGSDGPVTPERLFPVLNRLVAAGRSPDLPDVRRAAPLDPLDSTTWWQAVSTRGAYAPVGRAGAQDVAALHFSSTEIAGGCIVVGLPRSGKSTALHSMVLSICMLYPPEELELFLIDSKHGVEFKSYDSLPHARMVSIHSERELATSVLRALDNEIARRAELMKRTAGTVNVNEYREVTGEVVPRIVLIMDEFHEVFEIDDALGNEAFQAFSNIVRQGPFAGVHTIVSSQTLSSMPAMDRPTLDLLPMRMAFMCNDIDADIVMGDDNREVRALSRRGEGIFNPLKGKPSYNKPFVGMYIEPSWRGIGRVHCVEGGRQRLYQASSGLRW